MDATAHNVSAFRARCLLRAARWASLATSRPGEGDPQPFVSLITPAVTPEGDILLLLSALAAHAGHLEANPRCAVMVTGEPENLNWQTAPRLTITGQAAPTADEDARAYWLARHPYAHLYASLPDFAVWRIRPSAALFVAGFGRISNLGPAELAPDDAAINALTEGQAALLAHCNGLHAESLNRLAHAAGASGRWQLFGVDTDGLDLVQDEAVLRVAFPAPVADIASAQAALLALFEAAGRHF